jgi:hypothetical protein
LLGIVVIGTPAVTLIAPASTVALVTLLAIFGSLTAIASFAGGHDEVPPKINGLGRVRNLQLKMHPSAAVTPVATVMPVVVPILARPKLGEANGMSMTRSSKTV